MNSIFNESTINNLQKTDKKLTLICSFDVIINNQIFSYLETKNIEYYDVKKNFGLMAIETYNEFENRFYEIEEIRNTITKKVISNCSNKIHSYYVFIFFINNILNPNMIFNYFNSLNANIYYINLSFNAITNGYSLIVNTLQHLISTNSILESIAYVYKRISNQSTNSIKITRENVIEFLEKYKYFYTSSEHLFKIVEIFFGDENIKSLDLILNVDENIKINFINVDTLDNLLYSLNESLSI